MRKIKAVSILAASLCTTLVIATPGFASSPTDPPADPAAATAAQAQTPDDDAAFEPAEPDFRLINLPTTLRLPRFKGNFDLTHRFNGNLRRGTFADQASSLFGVDEGATVGFEYRLAVARHLEAIAYRTAAARTIQLYAKYDAIHQHAGLPVSASALVSIEGTNNLREHYAPALGVTVSRTLGDLLALYAVPTWVHNSAAAIGVTRDTVYFGVGGRLRFRPTVYFSMEVSPRLSGYAPGKPVFGFALDKRAGGHMFQINFTNTSASTFAQLARGGNPNTLSLGFNLARKFF